MDLHKANKISRDYKKLSGIVDEGGEVNFISLNTYQWDREYEFNVSKLFWKEESLQTAVGDWIEVNGNRIRTRHPGSIPHEVAGRTITTINW